MQKIIKFILTVIISISVVSETSCQDKSIDSLVKQPTLAMIQFIIRDSSTQITNWTIDYGELYDDEQRKVLDSIISGYEQSTTIEICIITLDSTMTTKEEFDDYVLRLHNALGVGKKYKHNGIVIGISQSLRKMRISNGYGIEDILSDSETKHIIDTNFTPWFKKSEFYNGTLNGLKALIAKLDEKMKRLEK